MKLTETESLGILYDHHRGVGNIDSYLYHGSGHQNPRFAIYEKIHLMILLGGFHLPVNVAYPVIGKCGLHSLVALFETFQIEFLILMHEGIDYIYLASFAELGIYKAVDFHSILIIPQISLHRFASGRQLVDY